MPDHADLEAFLVAGRERRMDRWMEFVRIPSVSAQPEHAACRRAAEWLANDLTAAGLEHVSIEETGGQPLVYGDWLHAAGGPTVIAYGHYRAGGSVPVTASFSDLLGLPVVLLGFAPPDSQAHAPNEFMDLGNFETGIRTIARCWDEMAVALGSANPDR
jgi:acetylornithine deacetylase/succinyl-diaminopimelate desuccinylase-like protein